MCAHRLKLKCFSRPALCSERYRDLIGAADCIVRMKETALMVEDNISRMRHSCDIHALKRNVAAKTTKARSGSMGKLSFRYALHALTSILEPNRWTRYLTLLPLRLILDDMQKSLYTSAAQIKLLADVPEQVTISESQCRGFLQKARF